MRAPQSHAQGWPRCVLKQYDLASREGVILMCLAEALLRIPDAEPAIGSLPTDRRGQLVRNTSATAIRCSSPSTWG